MKQTEEQLKIIEEMIETAKGNIKEGSVFYLIWGWLVFLAASINYILLNYSEFEHHWVAWPILMTLGGILSGVVGYKQKKKSPVKTYAERAMNYLWLGFLVTLLGVLFGMGKAGLEASYPIIMLLYGLGTFVSGGILKFLPLRIGGIISWACGIFAFQLDFSNQLLMILIAILASYIVPGHLLAKSKQHV